MLLPPPAYSGKEMQPPPPPSNNDLQFMADHCLCRQPAATTSTCRQLHPWPARLGSTLYLNPLPPCFFHPFPDTTTSSSSSSNSCSWCHCLNAVFLQVFYRSKLRCAALCQQTEKTTNCAEFYSVMISSVSGDKVHRCLKCLKENGGWLWLQRPWGTCLTLTP